MAANRRLARAGRDAICQALGVAPPAPDEMLGSMAAVLLPGDPVRSAALSPLDDDPLQVVLRDRFGIEVPVLPWPQAWAAGEQVPRRLLRISAHLYNSMAQYERVGDGAGGADPRVRSAAATGCPHKQESSDR